MADNNEEGLDLPERWLLDTPIPVEIDETRSLSVMQFNTLADCWADAVSFPYVDKKILAWTYRRVYILKQILQQDPDILTLQVDHYADFFLPQLQQHGYAGEFRPKKDRDDGSAIFWKTNKLHCVERVVTPLTSDKYGAPSNLPTFAFTVALKSVNATPEYQALVTNVHLKAGGPEQDPIRTAQAAVLVDKLQALSKNRGANFHIVCGDFNSGPKSEVYRYLLLGKTNSEIGAKKTRMALTHPMNLNSAYQHLSMMRNMGKQEDAPFTYYVKGFCATIDFIWYSPVHLDLLQLLDLPDAVNLRATPLPRPNYGSDHLALYARFQVKK